MAILAIAIGVSFSSLTSMLHARSYKAAKTIDGMIAQSKINAMSGRKNGLFIKYDTAKKAYVCSLYYLDPSDHISGEAYEQQEVGNDALDIKVYGENVHEESIKDGTYTLRIIYNMDTGAVKNMAFSTNFNGGSSNTDLIGSGNSTAKTAYIILDSYTTHTITLYKSTGEHILD